MDTKFLKNSSNLDLLVRSIAVAVPRTVSHNLLSLPGWSDSIADRVRLSLPAT